MQDEQSTYSLLQIPQNIPAKAISMQGSSALPENAVVYYNFEKDPTVDRLRNCQARAATFFGFPKAHKLDDWVLDAEFVGMQFGKIDLLKQR